MSLVHIHAPQATEKSAMVVNCQSCKKPSLFLSFFTPWYGWHNTCMRCGREWQDGEAMALMFYRYARRDNKAAARKRWRRMVENERA